MARIAALIVAAGRGERLGGSIPKQYQSLGGTSLVRRSMAAFAGRPDISHVLAVISPDDEVHYREAVAALTPLSPATGGPTRQESVRAGLEALAPHAPDYVLVHDAARPLLSPALIDRVIAALDGSADAAIPLLTVSDTLRRRTGDGRWESIPRDGVCRAQTPQGFDFAAILKAHRDHAHEPVTDDMALAQLAGLRIATVAGEETNMKITTPEDMATAERLLAGAMETRTGSGFDAHRFATGDHVWLCGVKIAHTHALEGHSDADCGLHALTDAILGALGAGDIGQHFPPTDERWLGAPSSQFLEHAAKLVRDAGGTIRNCDVTLICEAPKIAPHRDAMRGRIAEILKLDVARVSVKATTTEGMGFTGRREGLAAQAVVAVETPR
jgi:2-C-methyl-D-erythritol 4-phosphate cytidylyltransferase/2-C-methyl-D-erythritol 2,4-cyclodiphosphate synthase